MTKEMEQDGSPSTLMTSLLPSREASASLSSALVLYSGWPTLVNSAFRLRRHAYTLPGVYFVSFRRL